ncbi:MAG: flagellar P-ring protein precursor FlgI [Polaribacter sp.]|jgi:flagellar P-ring protein precursor FlgI
MKQIKLLIFLALVTAQGSVLAERIKDITSIKGVRTNQLVGYGLVVGLDGSGDKTAFTVQSLKSMLGQYGITLPANVNPQVKNIAAVAIHAELPAFAKIGQTIDITVSSLGSAKSLRGGSLLMSPLKGVDGNIYAMAQGNLIVGGLGVEGADGSSVSINIPSVGRIPNGASIEREIANPFASGDNIVLHLKRPDFTTAKRLADTINRILGPNNAFAKDSVTVAINAPQDVSQRVGFVSFIENLEFQPGEAAARIIINSRSGTVVIGNHVKVYSAAVSHGNLTVTITNSQKVSQPELLSNGVTTKILETDIEVSEEGSRMFRFPEGVTLSEIVRAVNQVGASPGDLVAILESLKQVGALSAELIVI